MITQDLLQKFDTCLKSYCQYAYAYYDEPLPKHEIESHMLQMGMQNEIDFKTLYEWKNGIDITKQDYSVDMGITIAGNIMSLKDSLVAYKNNLENNWWKKSWIPFVANYQGEYLLIETQRSSPCKGVIYFYSPNLMYAIDGITYYDSLEKMLKTIITLFEEGALIYDYDNNFLNFNFELVNEISAKLNPASNRWKPEEDGH